jgi:hypothetical protein
VDFPGEHAGADRPAGPYHGTTTVTKIDDTFYEANTEGEGPNGAFKAREIIAYHKQNKTLARQVTDSRGFSYMQFGPVGGDLGGIYNIHFDSAPFTVNGKSVRVRHVLRLLSPLNYRVASSISVDGGRIRISARQGEKKLRRFISSCRSLIALSTSALTHRPRGTCSRS